MSNGNTVSWNGMVWNTAFNPAPGTGAQPVTAAPPEANPPYYGQNLWLPQNVSVVGGNLQLTVQQNSGWIWNNGWQQAQPGQAGQAWAAAEAVLVPPSGNVLTYGTYLITVIAGTPESPNWTPFTGPCTAGSADTNTIFGAFVFDPQGTAPYSEIDLVEVGYQAQNQTDSWINKQPGGPTAGTDAQFCVQPWDGAGGGQPDWSNVQRIALDQLSIPSSGEVTFAMVWQANAPVKFYAAYGRHTSASFPFATAPFSWTSGVNGPSPTPTLTFFLNLWPYGGPSTGLPETFTVVGLEIPMAPSA